MLSGALRGIMGLWDRGRGGGGCWVIREVSQSTSISSDSCVPWSVSGSDSMGGETEADPSSLCCLQLGLEWREQLKLGNV